ncbi:MAG: aldolase/citrate lyase family protein, partial [Acidimicrobiaceae bacterium]|nr:aldolase/citrate lyase family protein [Acidimicrobiaceae bacterium]
LANLDAILEVPDIDAIYVGPADLSITLGLPPGNNDGEPAFDEALNFILERCAAHNVIAGIQSTGALTPKRIAAGFRMVTVTSDLRATRKGIDAELALARSSTSTDASTSMY